MEFDDCEKEAFAADNDLPGAFDVLIERLKQYKSLTDSINTKTTTLEQQVPLVEEKCNRLKQKIIDAFNTKTMSSEEFVILLNEFEKTTSLLNKIKQTLSSLKL